MRPSEPKGKRRKGGRKPALPSEAQRNARIEKWYREDAYHANKPYKRIKPGVAKRGTVKKRGR